MVISSCCECGKETASYRCPTCYEYYCSVACCREHKKKTCSTPESQETKNDDEVKYQFPTEDTVPREKLALLRQSSDLVELLNDTFLRKIIVDINNHSDPNKIIKFYMQQPEFSKFVDILLNVIEPQKD